MNERLVALIDRGCAPEVLVGVDRDRATEGLRAAEALGAWCEAQKIRWAQVLAMQCEAPEVVVAEVSRCSPKEADRLVDRAATLDAVPGFAEALEDGRVAAGHVDALTRGLASLDNDDQRARLVDEAQRLEQAAVLMTPDDFAKRVRREVQRIQVADGTDDPHARLARQRRAARLRTWVERESGMWCLSGRFDPLTGFAIHNQLQDTVNTLFREQQPADAPNDPGERQDHLRALAFAKLMAPPADGEPAPPVKPKGSLSGVVVIDTAQLQPDGTPAVPPTPPARSTWVAAHGSPTGHSVGRCTGCIGRVRCRGVGWIIGGASCTTSSGGATAASPTSTTCYHSANDITMLCTTAVGPSPSAHDAS